MNPPDCFCDNEAWNACDWQVEVEVRYSRPSDPGAQASQTVWKMDNIPQPLAQVLVQTSIDAVNERSAAVYLEWLKACFGENDPVVKQVAKTLNV